MAAKKKKIGAAGKFGAGYGINVRKNYNAIEVHQRKRQVSPFYSKARAVRLAKGIWKCKKTGKVFAGPAYYLEAQQ